MTRRPPLVSHTALAADRKAALQLTSVSCETLVRLDLFVTLLLQWQAKTNLVASSTLAHLWTRHIADSAQLLRRAPDAKVWADFGSGAGFPGLVLACMLADTPGTAVHLIERNAKKAAFLREALRVTKGVGVVHPVGVADSVDSLPNRVDCISARALAPLNQLLGLAEPIMASRGAKALFMKGRDVEVELNGAAIYWDFERVLHPSMTGEGWIVEVERVARRTASPTSEKSK